MEEDTLMFFGQFENQSGPNAVNQYKITFSADESQKEGVLSVANKYNKGDAFLITLIPLTDSLVEDASSFVEEQEEDTKKRLRKQMYALIRDIAARTNRDPADVKTALKEMLKNGKHISSSTSELDTAGFAAAIFLLQTNF